MVTDERIIFVTSISTNYASTPEKISQVQKFLTNLTIRVYLAVPEDIWLISKDLNLLKQYNDDQSFESLPNCIKEDLHNMENLLEY